MAKRKPVVQSSEEESVEKVPLKEKFAHLFTRKKATAAEDLPATTEPSSEGQAAAKTTASGNFQNKLMTLLSHVRLYKRPLFIQYKPKTFALKGHLTYEIMKLIQPGDILVRSFNGYLDGRLTPGTFTHAGFYLGAVGEAHLKQIAKIEHSDQVKTGPQMVIHKTPKGIFVEDLINFCRCDGLAIMRFPAQLKPSDHFQLPEKLETYFDEFASPGAHPLAALIKAEQEVAIRLMQGKAIPFEKIMPLLYRIALSELSVPHEFNLGFDRLPTLDATELVYFITKSIVWNYGIEPVSRRVMFKPHQVVLPDDYVDAELDEIWKWVG
jgi:hypothetical protein